MFAAGEKTLTAGLDMYVITRRIGFAPARADICPEMGLIRALVLRKPDITIDTEDARIGRETGNIRIELRDPHDKLADKFHKIRFGIFKFLFVGLEPIAVIVVLEIS
jgi:hypothetical protein